MKSHRFSANNAIRTLRSATVVCASVTLIPFFTLNGESFFDYDPNGNTISQQPVVSPAAPSIVTPPRDALLQPGGTVRFSVVAGGPGTVTYQWRHKGTDIPGATGDVLLVPGLAINLPDYGQYTVVVSNGPGSSTTSAPATVLPDSNLNGVADAVELQYFTTLPAIGDLDPDGDGVTIYDEIQHGSNPAVFEHYLLSKWSWFTQGYENPTTWNYRMTPGDAFQFRIASTDQPTSFSALPLPPGMSLNSVTGQLTGTPATGLHQLALGAVTGRGAATGMLVLRVPALHGWGYSSGYSGLTADAVNVRQVAARSDHTMALLYDGTVRTWGDSFSVPAGISGLVSVALGSNHALGLKADGTVVAWGADNNGKATVPSGLSGVVSVAAGLDFSLALKSDGTVVAWGYDATPPLGLANVKAIAAGDRYALAVMADGTVTGWGDNSFGQTNIPPSLSNVVAISANHRHSLALRSNGTVAAWGESDSTGKLSVPSGLTNVVQVVAGYDHSLALKADGSVAIWGSNSNGERDQPSDTGSLIQLAAGIHSMGMSRVGATLLPEIIAERFAVGVADFPFHFRVFTKNLPTSYAAAGLPAGLTIHPTTGVISGTPTQAGTFEVDLSATNAHGTAEADLTLYINAPEVTITSLTSQTLNATSSLNYQITSNFPASSYAATGLPAGVVLDANTGMITGTPQVSGNFVVNLTATTAYGDATATLTLRVRSVYSWGFRDQSLVPASLANVREVAGGGQHSLALRQDGTVVAFETDTSGQSTVPVGLSNVVAVAASSSGSLALKADRTVTAWGSSINGSITPPSNLTTAVQLAAGQDHFLALQANGTVRAWGGNNASGQRTVPTGLREVVAVASGGSTSYALTADGRIVVWGSTSNGEGSVPAGSNRIVAIAAGRFHCLALREDGTVAAWGLNSSGQATVPAGLTDVVAISAGTNHSLALKADGSIVAWGDNTNGQRTTPSSLGTAVAIAAGSLHSLGLSTKGSVLLPEIVAPRFAVAATSLPFWFRVPAKNFPTAYSATGLPDGVTIHPTTGVITGAPALAGTYEVTLSATNTHGEGTAALTLYVNNPVPVILSSTSMVTLHGLPATYQITSNVPCTSYAATNLPTGMSVDTTTGLISGTPQQKGLFAVGLSAVTAFGTATATLNLTVQPQLADAVDAPALVWTSGGTSPWTGQTTTTRDGTDAAQSGTITHSQESWLETTVTGPGHADLLVEGLLPVRRGFPRIPPQQRAANRPHQRHVGLGTANPYHPGRHPGPALALCQKRQHDHGQRCRLAR